MNFPQAMTIVAICWIAVKMSQHQYNKWYIKSQIKKAKESLVVLEPELKLLQAAIEKQRILTSEHTDTDLKLESVNSLLLLEIREKNMRSIIRGAKKIIAIGES